MRTRLTTRLRQARWGPPYWAYIGWSALSIAIVYGSTWLEQRGSPPSCYGIGWGCTPDPAGSAALFAAVIVVPALVFGCSLIAILGLLGVSRSDRLLAVNAVSGALVAGLVLVIAFE